MPITLKKSITETLQLFEVLKVENVRMFDDPRKEELITFFKELKAESMQYNA